METGVLYELWPLEAPQLLGLVLVYHCATWELQIHLGHFARGPYKQKLQQGMRMGCDSSLFKYLCTIYLVFLINLMHFLFLFVHLLPFPFLNISDISISSFLSKSL